MNKALISFLVATFFVVAFVEGQSAQNDKRTGQNFPTKEETKAMLVAYLQAQADLKLNADQLNAKPVNELLDLAIGTVQTVINRLTEEKRIAFLKSRIAYYENLKEAYKGQ